MVIGYRNRIIHFNRGVSMIRAFTGLPGAGKSNALADIAHKSLKQGRIVFSNIAIKGTYKLTVQDMLNYRFPRGAVVLLDESGRDFGSDGMRKLPKEFFDLFTLHRHLGLDMYVAVQDFGMINIDLRRCIELTWWIKNYLFLPFYVHEGYYSLEKLGKMGRPDIKQFVWKSRKVRQRYNTFAMKHVFADKEEMPQVDWFPFEFKYKSRLKTTIQLIRIKFKRELYSRRYQRKLLKQIEEGFE